MTSMRERIALKRAFWDFFMEAVPDRHMIKRGNESSRWRLVPEPGLVVSQYITDHSVGVFVRGRWGVKMPEVIEQLEPFRPRLEGALGAPLGNGEFPYARRLLVDAHDREQWARMRVWLLAEGRRYAAILADVTAERAA